MLQKPQGQCLVLVTNTVTSDSTVHTHTPVRLTSQHHKQPIIIIVMQNNYGVH